MLQRLFADLSNSDNPVSQRLHYIVALCLLRARKLVLESVDREVSGTWLVLKLASLALQTASILDWSLLASSSLMVCAFAAVLNNSASNRIFIRVRCCFIIFVFLQVRVLQA